MFEIDSALRTLVERQGSDLHVKVGVPPTARLHGELVPLEGYQQLSPEDTEKAFHQHPGRCHERPNCPAYSQRWALCGERRIRPARCGPRMEPGEPSSD